MEFSQSCWPGQAVLHPHDNVSFLSSSGFLLLGGQGCRQSCSVYMEDVGPRTSQMPLCTVLGLVCVTQPELLF